jgi:polysaccharide pyruvyl transferase WcaK-like protein
MRTNDVYLCGYYGMKNSGDDALLLASAWGAKQYFETQSMVINSPVPLKIEGMGRQASVLVQQETFFGQNRLRQYRAAANSAHIVFGGGSVFHSNRDITVFRHMMMLAGSGPHRAIGVGLGPFKDSRAEVACKKFLNECDFVGVRDQQSFEVAAAIAPHATVSLTFDLAPLLLEIPYQNNTLNTLPRRGIGVALCPNERFNGNTMAETTRLKALAASLHKTYQATGEPIYLIDFNGHEDLGDSEVHDELRALLSHEIPVFRINYDSNSLRLLSRLGGLKVVIGMRLHASVMAFLVNTPVLSLNYHSKCDGWCEQIGLHKNYRIDATLLDSDVLTQHLVDGLEHGFSPSSLSPQQSLSLAKRNFLLQPETLGAALC